jgi:hypothetical protein
MEPIPYEAPKTGEGMATRRKGGSGLFLAAGVAAMLGALFFQNITLAGGSYRNVLLVALALTVIADACLATVVWRGPGSLRLMALVAMGPTLFVVADFIRRSASVF